MIKKGDIVYFKEEHQVHYTSGRYFLKRGPWIVIDEPQASTCVITSPITNENHFMFSSSGGGFNKLITQEEWRDLQIKEIIKYEN
jgi:hypothetical protein